MKIKAPHIKEFKRLAGLPFAYSKKNKKALDAERELIRITEIKLNIPKISKKVNIWCRDGRKYQYATLIKGTDKKIIQHLIDCPVFQITDKNNDWNTARQLSEKDAEWEAVES